MTALRLMLVSLDPVIERAWRSAFDGMPNVEYHLNRFENIAEWDAIVAPGNSFGIMDGGLDKAIDDALGVQSLVQSTIRSEASGELPVGGALIEPSSHPAGPIRYVVYTPTMRVPMDIRGTENVYVAMKAALDVIRLVNARLTMRRETRYLMKRVIVPALGMGTGRVSPESGAAQMALAYEHWLNVPERITWEIATRRHQRIREAIAL